MIQELLECNDVIEWEDCSDAYCKCSILKSQNRMEVILLCDHSEWKTSAAIRYLGRFSISNVHIVDFNEPEILKSKIKEYRGKISWFRTCTRTQLDNELTEMEEECRTFLKEAIYLQFPYWRQRREEIYLFAKRNIAELDNIAEILADEESKSTLSEILRCSAGNDVYRRIEGKQEDKYWDCYKHRLDENWINCGSAEGDTILKYIGKGWKYRKIYAFESNPQAFSRLQTNIDQSNLEGIQMINEYIGLKDGGVSIDDRFKETPISLINMDIEGAELDVLLGGIETIKRFRPVLAICAYHKAADLVDIPRFIRKTLDRYLIYLRKYRGFEPNTLNEYVYYAIPEERKLDG